MVYSVHHGRPSIQLILSECCAKAGVGWIVAQKNKSQPQESSHVLRLSLDHSRHSGRSACQPILPSILYTIDTAQPHLSFPPSCTEFEGSLSRVTLHCTYRIVNKTAHSICPNTLRLFCGVTYALFLSLTPSFNPLIPHQRSHHSLPHLSPPPSCCDRPRTPPCYESGTARQACRTHAC